MNTEEPLAIFRAKGIVKRYGLRTVLDHVSFSLNEGQVAIIEGGNGAGKTTLLEILSGHTEPESGSLSVRIGEAWRTFDFSARRRGLLNRWRRPSIIAAAGIRRVWQDSRLFPSLSLADNVSVCNSDQVGESILDYALRPIEVFRSLKRSREGAMRLLSRMKLESRSDSLGDALSLGQEKRLAIARAMIGGGRVMLLDEPLAGLDVQSRGMVLDLIKEFLSEPGTSAVIAEHRSVVDPLMEIATHLWRLENSHLEVMRSNAWSPVPHSGGAWQVLTNYLGESALEGLDREEVALPGGASLLKLRQSGQRGHGSAILLSNILVKRAGKMILGWDGNKGIQGLSLDLKFGEVGVLVAPNGWGKTTLLETIAGLLPVQSGGMTLSGYVLDGTPAWARARRGLRLLRARDVLFPNLTVSETMRLLRYPIMPSYLEALSGTRVGLLSGGERRRLGLATLGQTRVLLVDEPFSGLDSTGIQEAWRSLRPVEGFARLLAIPERTKGV